MSQKKATKLTHLTFKEGSFVGEGSNQAAHITLFKARDNYEDESDGLKEKVLVEHSSDKPKDGSVIIVDNINGGGSMSEQEKTAEAVTKADVQELQKSLIDLQKRAEVAEIELKKERDARIDREYLDKALTYSVPGLTHAELKDVLKSVAGNTEAEASIEKLLKSVSQIHKQSAVLTRQIGNIGAETAGDSWGQIEALAKAKIVANPKLDMSHAVTEVAQGNPELYERYQWERNAKMRGAI